MRRSIILATIFLLIAPVAFADPEICEDINDLANDWAGIADALEEDADEDVGDLDVELLERDVNALLPDTESLGDFLIDQGDRDEEDFGNILLDVVDNLRDVDGDDFAAYLVDRIDDVVDCMDHIVDYCDVVNE